MSEDIWGDSKAYQSHGLRSNDESSGVSLVMRSVSPVRGDVAGGTTVEIIVKEGGLGVTSVQFDGNAATIVSQTATVLTVKTPAGTAGDVDIYIESASSNDTWADKYRYTVVFSPTQTNYPIRITGVSGISSEFASRYFGAENPTNRRLAGLIRVEGKQQRKMSVETEYRDFYDSSGEEDDIVRDEGGTVYVNDAAPAPGTQIAMGMEEDLEPGDGGAVSFKFTKEDPDAYFEFEGFKYLYAELRRGI